jgi:hypothetical protein
MATLIAATEMACVDGAEFLGISFAASVVQVLHELGRTEEAVAAFRVYASYLSDLLASYPDGREEWMHLLGK